MTTRTVRRQYLVVVERWLTVLQIEAMGSIGPVKISASNDEYWVTGIRFYGAVHAILNGFTGTGSYNQPAVYDGVGQGESYLSPLYHPFPTPRAISQATVNEKPTPLDGWSLCAKTVQRYDENTVRDWTEEIDTLLVFVRVTDITFLALS